MKLSRACAFAIALACAAACAPAAFAAGPPASHTYTLAISPTTVAGGSSATFNFALTNTSSPGSRLGSATFTPPAGFQVTAASLPPSSPGSAAISGGVVQLSHLALAANASVNVSVTASSPETCGSTTYTWSSTANTEPNFTGPALTLNASASRLNTTTTTDCTLQFSTEPQSAAIGQDITGTAFDPSGPPVTVEIVDASDHVVTSSGAPVTVAVGNNPGRATLGGTTTVGAVDGVATFSDLTLNQPGNGYTLTASSPRIKGATSSAFDETTTAVSCPQNQSCQTSVSTATSNFAVTANPSPTAATLTVSTDVGTQLQCAGYTAQDPNWFSFSVTSANRGKLITYTVRPAGPGTEPVGSTQFCLGAAADFTTRAGTPAPGGTLPDGSSGFIGLLPGCTSSSGPCVDSRGRTPDPNSPTGFDVVLRVVIPAGFAGDPWGRA